MPVRWICLILLKIMSALCLDSGYPFRVLHGVDHIEKTAPLGALADFPPIEASGRKRSENAHGTDAR